MQLAQPFFDKVRQSLFGGSLSQSQVDGLNVIASGWDAQGPLSQLAYVFATPYHETAKTMQPVTEYGSAAYLHSKPYWPYIGRGFVQLTWEANYVKADKELGLGIELVANPEKALDPKIASAVLMRGMREGWFTGKKLSDYIRPDHIDYVGARRIINGTDRAEMIAGYATSFALALSTEEGTKA